MKMIKSVCAGLLAGVLLMLSPTRAAAQSTDFPQIELTLSPGGTMVFQAGDTEPSFKSLSGFASLTFNLNRFAGVEAAVGGSLGRSQDIDFPTGTLSAKSPHSVIYTAALVVNLIGREHGFVPYITLGAGGLSFLKQADVDITQTETSFIGQAGGGVKLGLGGRVGLRADYLYLFVPARDDAPAFFGREDRHGYRLTGGFTITIG